MWVPGAMVGVAGIYHNQTVAALLQCDHGCSFSSVRTYVAESV